MFAACCEEERGVIAISESGDAPELVLAVGCGVLMIRSGSGAEPLVLRCPGVYSANVRCGVNRPVLAASARAKAHISVFFFCREQEEVLRIAVRDQIRSDSQGPTGKAAFWRFGHAIRGGQSTDSACGVVWGCFEGAKR
jgi:hypothetical protein